MSSTTVGAKMLQEGSLAWANRTGKDPKDFDYSSVKEVLQSCNKHMNKDQTLVLISTVLPGTIRREFAPIVGL